MKLYYRDDAGMLRLGDPTDPASVRLIRLSGAGEEFAGNFLSARLLEFAEGMRRQATVKWWWPLTSAYFDTDSAADISGYQRDTLPVPGFVPTADGAYFNGDGLVGVQGPVDSSPVDVSQGAEISIDIMPNPDWKNGMEHHLDIKLGDWQYRISDWPNGAVWHNVIYEYLPPSIYIWIDSVLYHTEVINLPTPTLYWPAFGGDKQSAERTGTCRNLRARYL